MGDGVQVGRGLLSCLEKNTNLIAVLQGLGWFLYTNKMFTLVRVIVPGLVNCFVHGWCHGRVATLCLRRRVPASIQHVALSLLREGNLRYLSLGTFTCNSTKLTSVPIIAFNSNVHCAWNDPFSQIRSHISLLRVEPIHTSLRNSLSHYPPPPPLPGSLLCWFSLPQTPPTHLPHRPLCLS